VGALSLPQAGGVYVTDRTPTTAMTHIAIQETLDGRNVDWLEKVTDEQYQLVRSR
jgi:hypothetical protein